MRLVFSAVVVASLCAAPVLAQSDHSSKSETIPETPKAGLHLAKGQAKVGGQAGRRNPNLTYHGGPVRAATTEIHPIFWGTTWPGSIGDKADIIKFYQGASGSGYLGSNSEYTQTGGAHVNTTLSVFPLATDYATKSVGGGSTVRDSDRGLQGHRIGQRQGQRLLPGLRGHQARQRRVLRVAQRGQVHADRPDRAVRVLLQPRWRCRLRSGRRAERPQPGPHGDRQRLGPRAVGDADRPAAERVVRPAGRRELRQVRVDVRHELDRLHGNNTAWKIQGNWSNAAYNAGQGYLSGGTERTGCIDGYSHVQ